jgi:hypothetical protein
MNLFSSGFPSNSSGHLPQRSTQPQNDRSPSVPMDSTTSEHVLIWDTNKVATWVASLGYSGLDRRFADHDISGDVLVRLNDDLLKDLGLLKVGLRIQVLKAIYHLKCQHGVPIASDEFIPWGTIIKLFII